ncbi:hypothetical protein [Mycobacterium scrofulaceum]|uniref:Uncharacterized protein n=1 Tax=Mycobacterium scrofulaceum TaxID=1783 RepID=A0A1A2UDM8_MYCSC|nr:hypothetical protein [Mycobacterium scrofulaceum]OBH86641.1 hypothetical protein A5679_26865 [Mycobacterium scrofulaceum]
MSDQNPFRDKIKQILLQHGRSRYAKVLIGMNQNLIDAEIAVAAAAAGEPVNGDQITEFCRNVQLTLDDKLAKHGAPIECAVWKQHASVGSAAVNR